MKSGMTLTSILVAVALSGIIAVFGSRLVLNQIYMTATASLIDKGNTIMQFYANVLRDKEVWRCTLFDSANAGLKNYVLGTGAAVTQLSLREPNCRQLPSITPTRSSDGQEWHTHPTLTGGDRGGELLPKTGKYIADSVIDGTGSSHGWWKINLDVTGGGGRGDVDINLKLCLQESVFISKHKGYTQVPKSYKYKCPNNLTRRIRYNENAIQDDCASKAIISVTDRGGAGIINATCSTNSLLSFAAGSVAEHRLAPDGLFRPNDRQAIDPSTCTNRHPIIGTDSSGKLICGSGQALVEAISAGSALCGTDGGIEQVLCGFTVTGKPKCCTPKGPKGPKGLKGCQPVIRRGVNNLTRVCISRPGTGHCPYEGDRDRIISSNLRC